MSITEDFIRRYAAVNQPHIAELISQLRLGNASISHVADPSQSATVANLISIFTVRARRLKRFGTPHAIGLCQDVESLLSAWIKRRDARSLLWIIKVKPDLMYTVYVDAADDYCFGVARAVDDREITAAQRSELWGNEIKSA